MQHGHTNRFGTFRGCDAHNRAHCPRCRPCEVCGKPTRRDPGRCTNDRCATCHAAHCTPGGGTKPGHGRLWPTPPAKATRARKPRAARTTTHRAAPGSQQWAEERGGLIGGYEED